MKKFLKEFKAFLMRGNILDLAVGVIVGGAFGKIVTSLVNDILMPLISLAVGGVSVADWKWVIRPEIIENDVIVQAESALHYGNFLQTILDFLIIAFFIFLILRLVMRAKARFDAVEQGYRLLSRTERRALRKQWKAEGCTPKQMREKEEEAQRQAVERAAVEAAEKAAAEKAAAGESEQQLLTQIRDLLAAQAGKDAETAKDAADEPRRPAV